jgi:hypothetical protein
LKAGDQTAVSQTHQDAQTGGAGWKDVAVVLAPVVRPDLFGAPLRALTAQEQALVVPFVSAGTVLAPKSAAAPGASSPLAAGFPGGTVGLVLGLGILGAILVRPTRRRR